MAIGGRSCDFDKDNDPTIMRSVTAGKLLRYLVEDGGHVNDGEPYVEIEVMKMVMNVYAKATGKIKHQMVAGGVIQAGTIMGIMTLDDASKVQKAELFTETFTGCTEPETMPEGEVHQQFKAISEEITSMLSGYSLPEPFFSRRLTPLIAKLFDLCNERSLPLLEAREILFAIQSRIPEKVFVAFKEQLDHYEKSLSSMLCKFPAKEMQSIIDRHAASLESAEQGAFILVTGPLQTLIQRFRFGIKGHMLEVVQSFVQQYLDVERLFSTGRSTESTIEDLQVANADNEAVVAIIYSHSQVAIKNQVIKCLLDRAFEAKSSLMLSKKQIGGQEMAFQKCLEELASLTDASSSKIALYARTILIRQMIPPYKERKVKMEKIFLDTTDGTAGDVTQDQLAGLVTANNAVFDVLSEFFFYGKPAVQQAALEVYIRRAYVAYALETVTFSTSPSGAAIIQFKFHLPDTAPDDQDGGAARLAARLTSTTTTEAATVGGAPKAGGLKRMTKSHGGPKSIVSMGDLQAFERAHMNDAEPASHAAGHRVVVSRTGVITAFSSLAQLKDEFDPVSALFKVCEGFECSRLLSFFGGWHSLSIWRMQVVYTYCASVPPQPS